MAERNLIGRLIEVALPYSSALYRFAHHYQAPVVFAGPPCCSRDTFRLFLSPVHTLYESPSDETSPFNDLHGSPMTHHGQWSGRRETGILN